MKDLQSHRVALLQGGALLAAFLVAVAAPARAQQAQTDSRWQAWLGCWAPVNGQASGQTARAPVVCVLPTGGIGVAIVTVVGTEIVTRDTIEVTGERHAVARAGCTGWESAQWSAGGERVYRQSEYACPGDVRRSTSELIAMTPSWDWLDVQGLVAHGGTGVRVLRYRMAAVPEVAEIASSLGGMTPDVKMARGAAAAPPTTADVVEASHRVDAAVVEAWVAEEEEGFPLTGKHLVALADSGVPARVIDVMVAMSYPKVFAVTAPSTRGEFSPVDASRRAPAVDTSYAYRQPYYGPGYYQPYGWDYYSPYSWSPYGYYSPFGYGSLGWGYSPYGYGGYYGGGTIVIVPSGGTEGGGNPPQPHGRVVNGHGYTRNQGNNAGAQPQTRSQGSGSAGSTSSGRATSSSSGSSSSSSSGSGQKAHPRP